MILFTGTWPCDWCCGRLGGSGGERGQRRSQWLKNVVKATALSLLPDDWARVRGTRYPLFIGGVSVRASGGGEIKPPELND